MKVAVTGGAGFLGRWVMKGLRESGHHAMSIDLQGADQNFDLIDRASAEKALDYSEPDAVIQLAALAGATGKGGGAESFKEPWRFIDNNVRVVNNVFEACRKLRIRKVVNMSSFAPYGKSPCPLKEDTPLQPLNPYGTSKAMVEEVARVYSQCFGIKTVSFRVPLICGKGQKEMNALREFVQAAKDDRPLQVWGSGRTLREFVHPSDVARAYLLGLDYMERMERPYDLFVLGSEPVSMFELASKVAERVKRGRIEMLADKPNVFDQYTDHSKAESRLEWKATYGVDEIIDEVATEAGL